MGSVYRRGKKPEEGKQDKRIWWIKYYQNGKPYRESSGSRTKKVAENLLKRREGRIADGKSPGVHFEKVTFEQLAEDFILDYKINEKKSLVRAERSVKHLGEFFGNFTVPQIKTPKIREYISLRKEGGASNASVNRELSALKRLLNLGANQTPPLVDRVPSIPMLTERNARKGFFEHWEFLALREKLPTYLKGFTTFGYKTGWRLTEIETLTWSQVDMGLGIVRLEVGETKNDEGRTIYLDDELNQLMREELEKREKGNIQTPYVFLNSKGTDRIKRFDKAWKRACEEAGIGHKLFHDLRRTAVRNMVRAGVPEQVAMRISGHKSRCIFERYNITNDTDLKKASQQQQKYLNSVAGTI